MKAERINQDQVRFTIDASDLIARNLRVSELQYGSQKTQALFDEMMKAALDQFGMDFSEKPVMIEAVPLSEDTLSVTVTRVEGMAELGNLIGTNLPGNGGPAENGAGMPAWNQAAARNPGATNPSEAAAPGAPAASNPFAHRPAGGEEKDLAMTVGDLSEPVVFMFRSLEPLLSVAASVQERFNLKNRLLTDEMTGDYYLVCEFGSNGSQVRHLIAMLCQFSDEWVCGRAMVLMVEEHTRKVIAARALQKLGVIQRS